MKVISKSWSTLRYRLALVIASDGRQAAGPKKRKPSSSAALFSRTEPGGEPLAVPAPEPPRQPCLRELRRHRCRTGSHHLHHDTTLGIGHNLMPLVSGHQEGAVVGSNRPSHSYHPYAMAARPLFDAFEHIGYLRCVIDVVAATRPHPNISRPAGGRSRAGTNIIANGMIANGMDTVRRVSRNVTY